MRGQHSKVKLFPRHQASSVGCYFLRQWYTVRVWGLQRVLLKLNTSIRMRNDKETFITQHFRSFISLTMVEGFDSGFKKFFLQDW